MKDPESKTRFFQAVAAKIAEFELEIERENYIEAVAEKYQISFDGMRKMVMNCLMQGVPLRAKTASAERRQVRLEKEDGILKSMRLLLTWLSEYPGLYKTVSAYVKPEDFTDELYKEVAEMLYEQLEKGELNPARIINHFTDPQQQRTAAQIFNTKVRQKARQSRKKRSARAFTRLSTMGSRRKQKNWMRQIYRDCRS